jgi:hypothetical protein
MSSGYDAVRHQDCPQQNLIEYSPTLAEYIDHTPVIGSSPESV